MRPVVLTNCPVLLCLPAAVLPVPAPAAGCCCIVTPPLGLGQRRQLAAGVPVVPVTPAAAGVLFVTTAAVAVLDGKRPAVEALGLPHPVFGHGHGGAVPDAAAPHPRPGLAVAPLAVGHDAGPEGNWSKCLLWNFALNEHVLDHTRTPFTSFHLITLHFWSITSKV